MHSHASIQTLYVHIFADIQQYFHQILDNFYCQYSATFFVYPGKCAMLCLKLTVLPYL